MLRKPPLKTSSPRQGLPLWLQYTPTQSEQVAMQTAKRAQVRDALTAQPPARARLLVLSGPTGASKSTIVRVLAAELGINILEWEAPQHAIGDTPFMDAFRDFITGALLHDSRGIVLVDDLPNVMHEGTRSRFESAIAEWLAMEGDAPLLVVVLTELAQTDEQNEVLVARRVFGQTLGRKDTLHIKVNPVSVSDLKSCLVRVATQERGKLSQKTRQCIHSLSQLGDVRGALNGLQVHLLDSRGETATDPSRQTSFFHALGKVIYGSSAFYPEDLYAEHGTLLNLAVLDNYANANRKGLSLAAACGCAEALSLGDQLGSFGSFGSYGLRGVRHAIASDGGRGTAFVPLQFAHEVRVRRERASHGAQLALDVRLARVHSFVDRDAVLLHELYGFHDEPELSDSDWLSD